MYYKQHKHNNRMYFAVADLDSARDVFTQLKLTTIPHILYFGAHNRAKYSKNFPLFVSKKDDFMETQRHDISSEIKAEEIADFIYKRANIMIRVDRPFLTQYGPYIITGFFIMIALYVFIVPKAILFFTEKQYKHSMFWFAISMYIYFLVLCGVIFNAIRNPPWFAGSLNNLVIIRRQLQNQFILEGILCSGMIILGSLCFIGITEWAPKLQPNWKKRVYSYAFMFSFFYLFNKLSSIMGLKMPGYPYAHPFYI